MKNLILAVPCCFFLLQSCKKEDSQKDHVELIKENATTTKASYKNGKLVSSEVYDKSGQLDSKYLYQNGTVIKIYQYFPDQKVSSYSYLTKAPNHYITTIYYKNGKTASEGEGDYYKDQNLYLRRGEWIFYSKSGEPYSVYGFMHDGKKQYIKREIIFDTIKKKTLKDVNFDPPFLYEKETVKSLKPVNSK
ncbi:hypothetical protein [Chryseobacterium proteolyticum]|uniref:hypothetical protein n=1 Tax=Chryseobacterium proteolyticum TaxID=118127 RepID=UPI00398319CF